MADAINIKDNTSSIESDIKNRKVSTSFSNYKRFFLLNFSDISLSSVLYFSIILLTGILTPFVAWLWKMFIDKSIVVEKSGELSYSVIVFLFGYGLFKSIQIVIDIMSSSGGEMAWRFDIIHENRFNETILNKVYTKIMKLSPEYFEVAEINDVISRALQFSGGSMRELIVDFYSIIADIITAVSIFIALYIYNPLLCFIAIIAPIPSFYSRLIGGKLHFKFSRDTTHYQRKLNYFESLLRNGSTMKEIKVFNIAKFIEEKWEDTFEEYTKKQVRVLLTTELISLIGLLINNIVSVSATIFAIYLMTKGAISLGDLGAVMVLITALINSSGSIFNHLGNIFSKRMELAQFFEFLDLPEDIKVENTEVKKFNCLKIRNISYRYPLTNTYALKDINLSIKRGDKIAFVGENGAGKSTMVKLLMGIISPSKGNIEFNGINKDYSNNLKYINMLSVVFQDYCRYVGLSLKDNIKLSDYGKNDIDLIKKIIDNMDLTTIQNVNPLSSIDTMLGREVQGAELSGGQWQKIAVGRGIYRERDIIILDEPTASIDPITEINMFKQFLKYTKEQTIIIVTHRIGTAALADKIYVFKDGEIVEGGTHNDLIKSHGEYSRLFNVQAEWYKR